MRFLLRKIVFYVVALWAAVTLNFFIPRMMPGNPVDVLISKMSAGGIPISADTRRNLEIELGGINQGSMAHQYWAYIVNLLHGNLGVSISSYPQTVAAIIRQSLPWTLGLMGLSAIIAFLLGITLGMFAGWKRGSFVDNVIPFATIFQAVPYFWLALILLLFLSRQHQFLPFAGGYDYFATPSIVIGFNERFLLSALQHAILPALTIVMSSIAGWMMGMRNMMVSTLSEDFILTAQAKGLTPGRIRMRYAARNAIVPSLSGFAITLGFVVAGSLMTELVFSYPGIGYQLMNSVLNNDYPLAQGCFLVISIAVLAANLIVDLLLGFIDPRTRVE
ncbi:MAG: ABC transporter permease [Propionibacteriaceae bacterium]|nr:ABC transporter permease [Propionibacteriaceae bacterium]